MRQPVGFCLYFALQTMKRKYIDALYTDCQVDYICLLLPLAVQAKEGKG